MPLFVGILSALLAAVLYSVGVLFQALEARQAPATESLRLSLLTDLVRRPKWLIGTACVAGGWAAQAVALVSAPVTVVQPALALSIVVLLVVGARWFGERVERNEVIAATLIVVGVAGLVAVSPRHGEDQAAPLALAIGMTALGVVAIAPYVMSCCGAKVGGLVALSAGLAYAWTGFSTNLLADGVSSGDWLFAGLWMVATVIAAVMGLMSEMTALQDRPAIRVFPIVLVVQIVVAVLLAPLLAGEVVKFDPLVIGGAAVSLALIATGTRALARANALESAIAAD